MAKQEMTVEELKQYLAKTGTSGTGKTKSKNEASKPREVKVEERPDFVEATLAPPIWSNPPALGVAAHVATLLAAGARTTHASHVPTGYRGRVFFHALSYGGIVSPDRFDYLLKNEPMLLDALRSRGLSDLARNAGGRLVGGAELVDCRRIVDTRSAAERRPGARVVDLADLFDNPVEAEGSSYYAGGFVWSFADAYLLPAELEFRAPGARPGFWELPASTAEQLARHHVGTK